MFGRRGNRANHYMSHYYPHFNTNMGTGWDVANWRQMQHHYYPNPLGNMGSFTNPYHHSPLIGNSNFNHNGYPSFAPQPFPNSQFPSNGVPMQPYSAPIGKNNYSQHIFDNPLEPEYDQQSGSSYHPYFSNSYMNPYPKQSIMPKQPSGFNSILNSFKTQNGSIDVNKMMNTAGQMLSAVNQVSSLVKGLGGIIKI